MKKTIIALFTLVLTLSLVGCGSVTSTPQSSDQSQQEETTFTATHHIAIEMENYGTILADLDANIAPITVENFVKLANEGFYDGLTFHRIISGFMIQGGDPVGNGTGGSGSPIRGEFSSNRVKNPLSHTRGAISMARAQDNNSASSQFFIVHKDSLDLDGDYAVFGYVTEGMEIVDQICKDVTPTDRNGTVPAKNQPIITSVKVVE